MEMQELEITIDNEGRVHLWVRGVKGEECVVLTKSLEKAIGDLLPKMIKENKRFTVGMEVKETIDLRAGDVESGAGFADALPRTGFALLFS